MRPMWKGAISFGLVNIPVKLYTATESKNIRFNFLHKECKTPIQYEKKCPLCDRVLENHDIVRGYEYEKGKYVVVQDEDIEGLPLESIKAIQILDFVNLAEIDPIYYLKSYFVSPNELGGKPYRLLYQALKETGKIAVAKVFLRTKETLAAIRVYENCLMMETMFFADEVRKPQTIPELESKPEIHDNELKMAKSLISNLTAEFKPEKYDSNYRKALQELIAKKVANEEIEIPREITKDEKIVDLMEALKASVNATEKKKKKAKTKSKKTHDSTKKADMRKATGQ